MGLDLIHCVQWSLWLPAAVLEKCACEVRRGRGEGILFLISLKAKVGQQSKNGVCHSKTERPTVLCKKD